MLLTIREIFFGDDAFNDAFQCPWLWFTLLLGIQSVFSCWKMDKKDYFYNTNQMQVKDT